MLFMPVLGSCRLFSVLNSGCYCCSAVLLALSLAGSIGRLLDHGCMAKPLPLVKDGDLVALVQHMIQVRGWDTGR